MCPAITGRTVASLRRCCCWRCYFPLYPSDLPCSATMPYEAMPIDRYGALRSRRLSRQTKQSGYWEIPNGPCCQCVAWINGQCCAFSISIVCMSHSHSHVHAYSSSSSFIHGIHRVSLHPAVQSFEQATAPPDPPAIRCLERLAAIEKGERSAIGLGRFWDFVCAQASAFHQSNEGGVSTVCESPTAYCVLASILMRS